MTGLKPNQQQLATLLENFDQDEVIFILADIANLPDVENMFNKQEMIGNYRKLLCLTENKEDNFSELLSSFAYNRYRELRAELGPDAIVNIMEEDEEKSRDTKENEARKKSEKDSEDARKEMEKKKKSEQEPMAKAIRSKGESQSDAADKLDVDKSTISRIKTGSRKPSFELMKKMAGTYGKGLINQLIGA